MSTQQSLTLSATSRCFGVHLHWSWPRAAREGAVVVVQALRSTGLTSPQTVQYPKEMAFIGGLHIGEIIQVRARALSEEGELPDWKASDWHDAKALSDAAVYFKSSPYGLDERINNLRQVPGDRSIAVTGEVYVADALVKKGSICMTAGDDIERQALREVLVETLPRAASGQVQHVAVELATAVRTAFKRLDNLRDPDAGKS